MKPPFKLILKLLMITIIVTFDHQLTLAIPMTKHSVQNITERNIYSLCTSTLRETRRATTRLNADKIPAAMRSNISFAPRVSFITDTGSKPMTSFYKKN